MLGRGPLTHAQVEERRRWSSVERKHLVDFEGLALDLFATYDAQRSLLEQAGASLANARPFVDTSEKAIGEYRATLAALRAAGIETRGGR